MGTRLGKWIIGLLGLVASVIAVAEVSCSRFGGLCALAPLSAEKDYQSSSATPAGDRQASDAATPSPTPAKSDGTRLAEGQATYEDCIAQSAARFRTDYPAARRAIQYCWSWRRYGQVIDSGKALLSYPGSHHVRATAVTSAGEARVVLDLDCNLTRDSDMFVPGTEKDAGIGFDIDATTAIVGCKTYSKGYRSVGAEQGAPGEEWRFVVADTPRNREVRLSCVCDRGEALKVYEANFDETSLTLALRIQTAAPTINVEGRTLAVPTTGRDQPQMLRVRFRAFGRVHAVELSPS